MANSEDHALRELLVEFLRGGSAHAELKSVVDGFPKELYGKKPKGAPHSAWQLLDHIRIALWDIVEFCRNPRHKSPAWPDGYWPKKPEPPSDDAWENSIQSIRDHLEDMRSLITDKKHDLLAPLPGGSGQTLLREALLIADHNAYHLGQLVLVRKALGSWKG